MIRRLAIFLLAIIIIILACAPPAGFPRPFDEFSGCAPAVDGSTVCPDETGALCDTDSDCAAKFGCDDLPCGGPQ